jgi:hypothetical protein
LHDLKVKTHVNEEKVNSHNYTEFIWTSTLRQLTDERIMPNDAMAHTGNCSIWNHEHIWQMASNAYTAACGLESICLHVEDITRQSLRA